MLNECDRFAIFSFSDKNAESVWLGFPLVSTTPAFGLDGRIGGTSNITRKAAVLQVKVEIFVENEDG
jgi:hypothetical protein